MHLLCRGFCLTMKKQEARENRKRKKKKKAQKVEEEEEVVVFHKITSIVKRNILHCVQTLTGQESNKH